MILTLSCPDRTGIVARVSGFLFAHGANILDAQQYNDPETGHFFMRVVFDPGGAEAAALSEAFSGVAEEFADHGRPRICLIRRRSAVVTTSRRISVQNRAVPLIPACRAAIASCVKTSINSCRYLRRNLRG